jgi:cyanophycinase-like exopeptidase
MKSKPILSSGTLTLIGSGEMSRSMGKVHREVMSRISGSVQAVFLDTPAGFELNADGISARAINYFEQYLQTELDVVSLKSAMVATPVTVETALKKLRTANYIFAGPGSPTYAVRNWRATVIFDAMARRLASGAHLVLASAAAIAVGRYALPVYEIYKAGEAPHWVKGLDLLGPYGLDLAIVPHWNNAEGGTHDTRYCFIGEPRLRLLEQSLPDSATILGIDEYTACILDLGSGQGHVIGAGQVTVRRRGCERTFPNDTVFPLDRLQGLQPFQEQDDARTQSTPRQASEELEQLSPGLPSDWSAPSETRGDDLAHAKPFIELLVEVRTQLRANKQWEMADEIRDRLFALGITLEDGPLETTWRRE